MSVNPEQLQKRAWALLWVGLIVHLASYATPMSFNYWDGNVWGEILLEEVLPGTFRASRWRSGWFIFLSLYPPFVALVYITLRFLTSPAEQRRVPSTGGLIFWLLAPNAIIPIVAVYGAVVEKNISEPRLLGYLVWNVSFWLFFAGFYTYKKSQRLPQDELADHLIDEN